MYFRVETQRHIWSETGWEETPLIRRLRLPTWASTYSGNDDFRSTILL